jgi:hypothetical protein
MFNSSVLEVCIGLVFCYASVALITSSIYETVSTSLNLRSMVLLDGIIKLLNAYDDDGKKLLLKIYNNALAHPTGDGTATSIEELKAIPSYIDSKHFTIALIESIQSKPNDFTQLGDDINNIKNRQLKMLLRGIYDRASKASDQFESFKTELTVWFDSAMNRISGTYKRKSQLWCFVIAFVFAAMFNIDTINLFSTLWEHPSLAAQIGTPSGNLGNVDAIKGLNTLPIGWNSEFHFYYIIGWCITATAALFGAPFWFDLLKQVVQLRGTGKKPA